MHRKGQMMAQPFIYIFALILAALILVWGVKMIVDFMGTADKAELGKTVEKIKSETDKYYNLGEDSSTEIRLMLPKGITYLCISEKDKPITSAVCKKKDKKGAISSCTASGMDTVLPMLLKKATNNLFTVPFAQAKVSNGKFTANNLKPLSTEQGDVFCIANGGKLVLTSKVSYVGAS